MWKSQILFSAATDFFPQGACEVFTFFPQGMWINFRGNFFHRLSFHIPQGLWKIKSDEFRMQNAELRDAFIQHSAFSLQAGIDIGCNIPDIILQARVAFF